MTKRNISIGISIPNLDSCYRLIVLKIPILLAWNKMSISKKVEDSDIRTDNYSCLTFNKNAKNTHGRQDGNINLYIKLVLLTH